MYIVLCDTSNCFMLCTSIIDYDIIIVFRLLDWSIHTSKQKMIHIKNVQIIHMYQISKWSFCVQIKYTKKYTRYILLPWINASNYFIFYTSIINYDMMTIFMLIDSLTHTIEQKMIHIKNTQIIHMYQISK